MKESEKLRVVAQNIKSFWGPGFGLRDAKTDSLVEEDVRVLIELAESLEAKGQ